MNKNLNTVISETKKDDEVIDEQIYSYTAKEVDTELEENTVMTFDDLTISGEKKLPLKLNNCNWMMKYFIMWLFILLKTLN